MTDAYSLGPWLRRFLEEYLVSERNLARNTQLSYRDTLVLLLRFAAAQARTPVDRLTVRDLGAERVRAFLAHLEQEPRLLPAHPQPASRRHPLLRPLCRRPLSRTCRLVRPDPRHSAQEGSTSPGRLPGKARDRGLA